jgi:hypothetical protein
VAAEVAHHSAHITQHNNGRAHLSHQLCTKRGVTAWGGQTSARYAIASPNLPQAVLAIDICGTHWRHSLDGNHSSCLAVLGSAADGRGPGKSAHEAQMGACQPQSSSLLGKKPGLRLPRQSCRQDSAILGVAFVSKHDVRARHCEIAQRSRCWRFGASPNHAIGAFAQCLDRLIARVYSKRLAVDFELGFSSRS